MADFFFFTDLGMLEPQDKASPDQDWFGPMQNNDGTLSPSQYVLDNFNNTAPNAPAYAITESLILFQFNEEGLLNAILKPLQQPKSFGNTDFDFFIYKGLDPNWVFENFSASDIYKNFDLKNSQSSNDIRYKLYEDHAKNKEKGLTTLEKPKAEDIGTLL